MAFNIPVTKFIGGIKYLKSHAAVDIGQLHYLVRQFAVEGKLATIDEKQQTEVFALLEKAENKSLQIGDYKQILSNVSSLIEKLDPEKVKKSPIFRTIDNNWSIARMTVIAAVFSSLISLVLLSAVFNKAKISHDRILELTSEESLKTAGIDATDKSASQSKKMILRQGIKAEIAMASSVVYSSHFVNSFVSWIVNINPPIKSSEKDTTVVVSSDLTVPPKFPSDKTLSGVFGNNPIALEQNVSTLTITEESLLLLSVLRRHLEQMIYILVTFLLPIAYGVFGSSVFLLRESLPNNSSSLAIQMSVVHVFFRVGLGAVAGIAVGWFAITDSIREFTATPFAVAFLAGFSFDLVFSFLEKVMSAFSSGSDGKK